MLKIELNEREELSDREIAFILLADVCGKVLAYPSLYPKQILHIARRYLTNGGKTMSACTFLGHRECYGLDAQQLQETIP